MINKHKLHSTALISIAIALMLVSIAGATPFAYITNGFSDTVSIIDTTTYTVTATVYGLNGPFGVAVTPDVTKAYVANGIDGVISIIDTATENITANVTVGEVPVELRSVQMRKKCI